MPFTTRSGRLSKTPVEAEAEREKARNAKRQIQRERDNERRKALRDAQMFIARNPPKKDPARKELDNMARAIHNSYNWGGRGDQCVTAIVKMSSGRHIVFPQRFMRTMESYAQRHYPDVEFVFLPGCSSLIPHLHAEMYAVKSVIEKLNGYSFENVESIGVSKEICPDCRGKLSQYKVDFDENYITAESSNHWVSPD